MVPKRIAAMTIRKTINLRRSRGLRGSRGSSRPCGKSIDIGISLPRSIHCTAEGAENVLIAMAENPGLKPHASTDFIQGAKAPCSLRRSNTGVFQQPLQPHELYRVGNKLTASPFISSEGLAGIQSKLGNGKQTLRAQGPACIASTRDLEALPDESVEIISSMT